MASVKRTKRESAPPPAKASVSESEIARRAFELYKERGAQDGRDLDDWLKAEAEVRARYRQRGAYRPA